MAGPICLNRLVSTESNRGYKRREEEWQAMVSSTRKMKEGQEVFLHLSQRLQEEELGLSAHQTHSDELCLSNLERLRGVSIML